MIQKILVSQPKPTVAKSPYFDLEKKYGVEIDFRSLITVERLSTKEFRAQKVNILDHTAIVFNSKQSIDHFFSMCNDLRIKMPDDMKYFFVSEKVAHYIQQYVQYRKRKVFIGKTGLWPDLIDIMVKHKKEKFLIPQSDVHNKSLSLQLDEKGLTHTDCIMYRTVSAELDKNQPFDYDMLVFFTPSGAKSLVDNYPDYKQNQVVFACFGESTANKLTELGYRVDVKAVQGQGLSMASAISQYLEENK